MACLRFQSQLAPDSRVGADPHTVPHHIWHKWDHHLQSLKFIRLLKLNRNLIDDIWSERPAPNLDPITIQPVSKAGEPFGSKLSAVRQTLRSHECDAMIVTSSTEIAYLLNLRGNDLPFVPVFKVRIRAWGVEFSDGIYERMILFQCRPI